MKNSDIEVIDIEFTSGQEPDQSEDFVTLVRVTYKIKGTKLARLLGKQMRVLDKYLRDLSKDPNAKNKILSAATQNREVLAVVGKAVGKFVYDYVVEEFNEPSGMVIVDFAEESDYPYRVKIDPTEQSVIIESEFDAMSS